VTEKYAVVEILGRQYKVSEGLKIETNLMEQTPGAQVKLEDVLMVREGSHYHFGAPKVAGASITATVVRHDRTDKIPVLKYLKKNSSKKFKNHRQDFTVLTVNSINV
jgi:large subunit ribosomal protein L21